ncbi:hypothetical protein QYE76_035616 [Lolium multiflorum]|uniref:Uncharacterized protein n=1 Tax=Lolium multiflorum TaxID=4521 RepID=A0AAD8VPD8_LOLMU|nr:hypothetical protein QYE76_035616 [Lolium multiflorum]
MEVTTDDSMSLSDDSGWSSSDDSDIEELLQDNDVDMMQILVEVQEFEERVKLMDHRRGSKMRRVTIYRNRALGHEHLMQDYFAKLKSLGNSLPEGEIDAIVIVIELDIIGIIITIISIIIPAISTAAPRHRCNN